ncbi:MAG TPA: hypothetical protein VIY51_20640 [Xanthobacteraceae bacterium]
MRASTVLLAATIAATCTFPASTTPALATVRITSDPGGQIGPYLEKLQSLRNSGQNVIIDGPCLSACTMLLGVIPRDRICVTPRAQLGFHAAWQPDQAGRRTVSPDGTELLMSVYPQQVRNWISRRGGLSPQLIYLTGGELASMYPSCNGSATAAADVRPRRKRARGGFVLDKAQGTSVSAAARIQ